MKNFILFLLLFVTFDAISQDLKKKNEIVIKTSAECSTCKKLIEDKFNFTKGIRYAELNVEANELTVGFSPKTISPEQIRILLANLGYSADDIPANPTAQRQLPKCCQPGGMSK